MSSQDTKQRINVLVGEQRTKIKLSEQYKTS